MIFGETTINQFKVQIFKKNLFRVLQWYHIVSWYNKCPELLWDPKEESVEVNLGEAGEEHGEDAGWPGPEREFVAWKEEDEPEVEGMISKAQVEKLAIRLVISNIIFYIFTTLTF